MNKNLKSSIQKLIIFLVFIFINQYSFAASTFNNYDNYRNIKKDAASCQETTKGVGNSAPMNLSSNSGSLAANLVLALVSGVANGVSNGMEKNKQFMACMSQLGWSEMTEAELKQFKQKIQEYVAFNKEIVEFTQVMCKKDEYQSIFSKTNCLGILSPEQLSNKNYISEIDKDAFIKFIDESRPIIAQRNSLLRQFNLRAETEMAAAFEARSDASDKNINSLFDKKITWGEYNKAKAIINQNLQAKVKEISEKVKLAQGDPANMPPDEVKQNTPEPVVALPTLPPEELRILQTRIFKSLNKETLKNSIEDILVDRGYTGKITDDAGMFYKTVNNCKEYQYPESVKKYNLGGYTLPKTMLPCQDQINVNLRIEKEQKQTRVRLTMKRDNEDLTTSESYQEVFDAIEKESSIKSASIGK